jgi:hypothetical protein
MKRETTTDYPRNDSSKGTAAMKIHHQAWSPT